MVLCPKNIYNNEGQLQSQISYKLNVSTANWFNVDNGEVSITTADFEANHKPNSDADDRMVSYTYDIVGRLESTSNGVTTSTNFYDAAGQILKVEISGIDGTRTSRAFYDDAGRIIAELDAEGYLTTYTYNALGQLVKQTAYADAADEAERADSDLSTLISGITVDSDNDQSNHYFYNNRGDLVGTVNAEGYLTETVYNLNGQVESVTVYDTALTIADNSTLASIRPTDPQVVAQTTEMEYLDNGLLFETRDYQGNVQRFEYDIQGNVVRTILGKVNDEEVRYLYNRYDESGRLVGSLDAKSSSSLGDSATTAEIDIQLEQSGVRRVFDSNGWLTQTIDAFGQKNLFYYNERGQLVYSINAEGDIVESRYNSFGDVTHTVGYAKQLATTDLVGLVGGSYHSVKTLIESKSDPLKDSFTEFTFNSLGQVRDIIRQLTDSTTNTQTNVYNTFGEIKSSTIEVDNSRSVTTSYQYDNRGLLTHTIVDSESGGREITTQNKYDAFGRIYESINAANESTAFKYDRLGRVTLITDPLNQTSETSYDGFNRVLTQTNALDQITTYQYDDVERSVSVIHPGNVTTKTISNEFGETIQVIDGEGAVTSFEYDDNGQLIKSIDASGNVSESIYDKAGRLAFSIDADGRKIEFKYDHANRVFQQIIDPDNLAYVTEYKYDGRGQTIIVKDANNIETKTDYDAAGRISLVTKDESGLNIRTHFEYDKVGNQVKVTEGYGTSDTREISYTYNKLGQLETKTLDPSGIAQTTSYVYDDMSNLIRTVDHYGDSELYFYNELNQLVYTVNKENYLTQNRYDELGRLIELKQFEVQFDFGAISREQVTVATIESESEYLQSVRSTHYVYNERGLLQFSINAENYVTENKYDDAGRLAETIKYEMPLTYISEEMSESEIRYQLSYLQSDNFNNNEMSETRLVVKSHNEAGLFVKDGHVVFKRANISSPSSPNLVSNQNYKFSDNMNISFELTTPEVLDDNYIHAGLHNKKGKNTGEQFRHSIRISGSTLKYYQIENSSTSSKKLGNVKASTTYIVEFETTATTSTVYVYEKGQARTDGWSNEMSVDDSAWGNTRLQMISNPRPNKNGREIYVDNINFRQSRASFDENISTLSNSVSTQYIYDAAGRQQYSIDAEGYRTENFYDGAGNLIETRRYESSEGLVTGTYSSNQYIYDAAGRQVYMVNAEGNVKEYIYDAIGQVTKVNEYEVFDGSSLSQNSDSVDSIKAQLNNQAKRTTESFYDSLGRVQYQVDAEGSISENIYDDLGQLIQTISYAEPIVGTITKSSITSVISDSASQSQYFIYDKLGRIRYTINSQGNVSETFYNSASRVVETYQYTTSYSGSLSDVTIASLEAQFSHNVSEIENRKSTTEYDAVGNIIKVTDANNVSESFTYDAFGNVVTFTNKKQHDWHYQYDKLGRVVEESTPKEQLSYWLNGTVVTGNFEVVTRNTYDYRSNVVSRTEGILRDGTTEVTEQARLSEYEYNANGNQTVVKYYGDVSDLSDSRQTITAYDAYGNSVVNKDVSGNYSYRVYDSMHRERFAIDAEGYVTEYQYDGYGNQQFLIRYSNKIVGFDAKNSSETSKPENFNAFTLAELTAFANAEIQNAENYRKVEKTFDSLGRVIRVIQPEVSIYDGNATAVYSDRPETVFEYDSLGRLIEEKIKIKGGASPEWAVTTHYYNDLDQRVGTVDALGYYTKTEYNDFGEIEKITEFAIALDSWDRSIPTNPEVSNTVEEEAKFGLDRITKYTYDKLGRRDKEIAVDFKYQTTAGSGAGNQTATDEPMSDTDYDVLGNIIKVTTQGNVVQASYNKLGHKSSVTLGEREVLLSSSVGVVGGIQDTSNIRAEMLSVSPYSEYKMDAFGNILQETKFAQGKIGDLYDINNSDNVVSRFEFDNFGNKVKQWDANGNLTEFSHDKAGNVTQESKVYHDAEGVNSYTALTAYEYDALGRQIATTIHLGADNQLQHSEFNGLTINDQIVAVAYNAFGEVIARGDQIQQDEISDIEYITALQEHFEYDAAGRLIASSGSDSAFGTTDAARNYQYDLQGNKTQEEVIGLGVTRYEYDKLGREEKTTLTQFIQSVEGEDVTLTPQIQKGYDRWGNVTSLIDTRNQHYLYEYNQNDQLVKEVLPLVRYVGEDADDVNITREAFTKEYGYDNHGNQIFSIDQAGNMRTKSYNSVGQLIGETDALNVSTHYAYDALGRQIAKQNKAGRITTTSYDKLNQAIALGDVRTSGDVSYNQELAKYVYNELGNQVQAWTVHSKSNDTIDWAKIYTDYDVRGNAIWKRSAETVAANGINGTDVKSVYDSQGRLVDEINGLWISGDSHRKSWAYDYFGKVQTFNDLSGIEYIYEYNEAGQLTRKVREADKDETQQENGQTINAAGIEYEYYENGLLKAIINRDSHVYSYYQYNQAGQRIFERTEGTDTRQIRYDTQTTTAYDAAGRIESVETYDNLQNIVTLRANYLYDKVGNRRAVQVMSQYDRTYSDITNSAPTATVTSLSDFVVEELDVTQLALGTSLFTDADIPRGDSLRYTLLVERGEMRIREGNNQSELDDLLYWHSFGFGELPSWMELIQEGNDFILNIKSPPEGAASERYSSQGVGHYNLSLRAEDESGEVAALMFDVKVNPYANKEPTIFNIGNHVVNEGDNLNIDLNSKVNDVESDPISLRAVEIRYEQTGTTPVIEEGILINVPIYSDVEYSIPTSSNWLTFNNGVIEINNAEVVSDKNTDIRLKLYAKETDTEEQYETGSNEFKLTVVADNDAPEIGVAPESEYYAESDQNFSLSLSNNVFTDPNGDTLNYSLVNKPDWMTYNKTSTQFVFGGIPTSSDFGVHTVTIKAEDDGGLYKEITFNVKVNSSPEFSNTWPNVISNQAGRLLSFNAASYVTNSDEDNLTFKAKLKEVEEIPPEQGFPGATITQWINLPNWLTMTVDGLLSGTPPMSYEGEVLELRVFVDDTKINVHRDILLNITEYVNIAPVVVNTIETQTVQETSSKSLLLPENIFSDADNNALTYSATFADNTPLPNTWLSFNASNNTFNFSPNYGNKGTYQIKVTASDNYGGSVSTVFTLNVTKGPNRAPVLDNEIVDRQIKENESLGFTVAGANFSDLDDDFLTYSYVDINTGGELGWIELNASTGRFDITPNYGDQGVYNIRVTASDGSLSVSDSFRLTVNQGANRVPTVNTIGNITVNEYADSSLNIVSYANDLDNDALSYRLVEIRYEQIGTEPDGEGFTIPVFGDREYTLPSSGSWLTASSAGVLSINNAEAVNNRDRSVRIKAYVTETSTSERYEVASNEFSVTVLAANDAPTLSNSPNTSYLAQVGQSFTLDLPQNTFSDPNGDPLTYSVTGKPSWLTFTASELKFSGTPSASHVGSYDVTLKATDPDGASVSRVISFVVNSAPVENSLPASKSTQAERYLNYNVASYFSDPDGHALTYTAKEAVTIPPTWEPELGEWLGGGTSYQTLPSWLTMTSAGRLQGTPPASAAGSTIKVQVTVDDGAISIKKTFDLNVTAYVNVAPVVNIGLGDKSVQETKTLSYTFASNSFTDADGHSLTYSATLSNNAELPDWIDFNASTRTFSMSPAYGNKGTYYVKVTASDTRGGSVSDTFKVTVDAGPNRAPYVNSAIPNRVATENVSSSYTFSSTAFIDPDGNPLTYSAKLSNGSNLPSWISFNASTRRFDFNPNYGHQGVYDITVTASDGSLSDSDTFRLTVNQGANRVPTVNTIGNITVNEYADSSLNIVSYANDLDNDALSYRLVEIRYEQIGTEPDGEGFTIPVFGDREYTLPSSGSWLTASSAGVLSINNAEAVNNRDRSVRIKAYVTETSTSERYEVASNEFSVTVLAANDAPTLSNSPNTSYLAQVGQSFTLDLPQNTFSDPNGDPLTYSVTGKPSWLTFTASELKFSGTPSASHVGSYDVTLKATDPDGASVSRVISFVVNSAPVENSLPASKSTQAERYLNYNVASYFSDPDGHALTYTAKEAVTIPPTWEPELGEWLGGGTSYQTLPSWLTMTSAGRLQGTPPASAAGSTIKVQVTVDDGAISIKKTFDLNVTAYVNVAPVVNIGLGDKSVQETKTLSYTFASNSFTDADGHSLTYSATLSNNAELPDWIDFNASTRTFSMSPAYGNKGTYYVKVTASDTRGGSVSDTFKVTVDAGPNREPYVNSAIPNRVATEGVSSSYTFSSTAFKDPDGNPLTYSAKLSNGSNLPSWINFNASTRKFTFNPAYGNAGSFDIRVTASDGSLSTSDVFRLTVNSGVNRAPVVDAGIPNRGAQETVYWSYSIPSNAFSDPDGDSLTYRAQYYKPGYFTSGGIGGDGDLELVWIPPAWTNTLPSWLSFDTATKRFTGTPPRNTVASVELRVVATDPDGLTASDEFTLSISNPPNSAPTVNSAIPNRSGHSGVAFSYTFPANTFSDIDGDTLTYSASGLPSWLKFTASKRAFAGTPPATGSWNITVTASDGKGGSVSDTFKITVTNKPNSAPVLNRELYNQSLTVFSVLNYTFAADSFTDADKDTLTYTATQSNGYALPSWLNFNASTRTFSGRANAQGHTFVKVTASDGRGGSVSDTFTISVNRPSGGGGGIDDIRLRSLNSAPSSLSAKSVASSDSLALKASFNQPVAMMAMSETNEVSPPQTLTIPDELYEHDFRWLDQDNWVPDNEIKQFKEYWYTYDAENRVTLAEGKQVANGDGSYSLVVTAEQGTYLEYDAAGNQILRVQKNEHNTYEAERFEYNIRGEMIASYKVKKYDDSGLDWSSATDRATALADDVTSSDSLWQKAMIKDYDLAGRMVEQRDYYLKNTHRTVQVERRDDVIGEESIDVYGQLKSRQTISYDREGRAKTVMNFGIGESYWRNQHIFSFNGDNIEQSEIAQMLHEAQTRVEVGDLTHLSTIVYGNDSYNAAGNLSHYQYEKLAKGENDEEENSSYVFSYSYAYGNAHEAYQNTLVSGSGSGENHKNGTTRTHYNASHQAIKTIEAYADDTGQITTQQHRYFRNNGDGKIIFKGWGEYDTSTQVYTEEDQRHYYYAQNELIGSIGKNGRILFDEVAGYQIASSENAGNAGSYTVQHGDTLKSIARLVYGSEALWYVIADANGMADSNPKLEAGQTLKTPSFATNVNDADTFKAYNMDEIIGDRTPAIPDVPPPPPADDGCGIIGQIIMIVVTVVVAYFTAGSLNITPFLNAAIGGFAGSVAGQLTGKALGVVDSFSLRQAVGAGLTAGAMAQIGEALKAADWAGKADKLTRWGKVAAAAISVPVGYAINRAIGLPSSFSWHNVAMAAVTAGITDALDGEDVSLSNDINERVTQLQDLSQFDFNKVLVDTGTGVLAAGITHVVRKALYKEGQWSTQSIVADAFGNALGNNITEVSGYKDQLKQALITQEETLALNAKMEKIAKKVSKGIQKSTEKNLDDSLSKRNEKVSDDLQNVASEAESLVKKSNEQVLEERQQKKEKRELASVNDYLAYSSALDDSVSDLGAQYKTNRDRFDARLKSTIDASVARGEASARLGAMRREPIGADFSYLPEFDLGSITTKEQESPTLQSMVERSNWVHAWGEFESDHNFLKEGIGKQSAIPTLGGIIQDYRSNIVGTIAAGRGALGFGSTYWHPSEPYGMRININSSVAPDSPMVSMEYLQKSSKGYVTSAWKTAQLAKSGLSGGALGAVLSPAGTSLDYYLDENKIAWDEHGNMTAEFKTDLTLDTAKGVTAGVVGGVAGAAAAGALVGSAVPVVGTIVGLGVGVLVGWAASWGIEETYEVYDLRPDHNQ